MNNNRDTIHQWLTEQLEVVEEQGALSIVSLAHIDGTGTDRELYSMKSGSPKWNNVDEMTDLFWTSASRHAKGLPGHQQFVLNAIFGSHGKPTRFLPFGLVGQVQLGTAGGGTMAPYMSTEGPTPTGQMMQSMRLQEMLVQASFADRNHVSRVLLEFIDKIVAENAQIKKENGELWLALREQFTKMLTDARTHQMDLLKFMRTTEMQRRLMTLAPAILNMLAGREIFPRTVEDTAIMQGIAELVDESTLDKLLMTLSTKPEATELVNVITLRLAAIRAQKAEDKEAERKLIKQATGGTYEEAERDASGETVRELLKFGRPPTGPMAPELTQGTPGPKVLAKVMEAQDTLVKTGKPPQASQVNGNGHGPHAPPEAPSTDDARFIAALLGDCSESDMQMLTAFLSGSGKADLAQEAMRRFQSLKKTV